MEAFEKFADALKVALNTASDNYRTLGDLVGEMVVFTPDKDFFGPFVDIRFRIRPKVWQNIIDLEKQRADDPILPGDVELFKALRAEEEKREKWMEKSGKMKNGL